MSGANTVKNINPVELLAKSFAQNLLKQGYSREDIVKAASTMIDQVLKDSDEKKHLDNRPLSA